MKKLDKLILQAFAGPFFLTFAVVQFILLTQYMLKYLDDIIGKDLGGGVLAQLLAFFSILIVPISLPLAVLLSSLMTYGTLGEHQELTAIKTSGISLPRILRPVLLVSLLLAGGAFWFNNTIVPKANLKAYSLLWDVRQQKLALDIREGIFYNGIPGYTIKVNKKLGENGDRLHGVMIYDHSRSAGNSAIILADSGRMFTRFGGQYLSLELYSGTSYIEQPEANNRSETGFMRQNFRRNLITFSLASFNLDRTKEELFSENKMMKNLQQLHSYTDSLQRQLGVERLKTTAELNSYYSHLRVDTTGQTQRERLAQWKRIPVRRLTPLTPGLVQNATDRARNVQSSITSSQIRLAEIARDTNNYRIEIYRKYTQSAAILIMFLIGAPLGSIIKKGGLGVPVLISIIFFIVFYVLSIIGEKYGREGVMPVGIGMWMANLILLPIGVFFLNQARHDSGLLEVDFWRRLPARLPKFLGGAPKA
ncbi:YjgP/YjgQ family permease [Hymenobacter lutimineralis]|uniref:YjgP/YjgQ family permease n=1 Tax=Hymenobacter lutimineralis TaxID=2606448 RepID=A0A5D6UUP0_9BACT|nr:MULTISPECIES: LptF/LptG family permease [Hymenobacter]QIX59723.1 YjgP/YjgQ family permease [Hymenobacter sp. BT18]TYZ06372.1 YjgP/YjgQ family permease [Hymenobacter lutimineralis]